MRYLLLFISFSCFAEVYQFKYIKDVTENSRTEGNGYCIGIGKNSVLTNAHLIDGENLQLIKEGKVIKCKLIHIDKELDLALLQTEEEIEYRDIVDDRELTKVRIKNSVFDNDAKLDSINGILYHYKVRGGKQGISGSGVFNKKNEIIGIVMGVSAIVGNVVENTAVVVPARRIIQFLNEIK